MGSYLNPGSKNFEMSLQSEIYIDKSGLIEQTNSVLGTQQRYLCVSRPRRFGKSMVADMLAAYYGCGEDSEGLFRNLKISKSPSYRKHLNQYDVIKINMQGFLSGVHTIDAMLERLQRYLMLELAGRFPDVRYLDKDNFYQAMQDIYACTGRMFIILIDEWDCLFREYKSDLNAQKKYLDFLRVWLKDQPYVALAYMTGILPVKKYGTHSALNMFLEYSVLDPKNMAQFFGFTEEEVQELCERYSMNFEETKAWYDGYETYMWNGRQWESKSIYSPKSVVEAMLFQKFAPYWNQTETYEALKIYIQMNFDGLKDAVVTMLAGGSIRVNTGTFSNDMTTFRRKDDVLTLLVHLGYLTYDSTAQMVTIPNREVMIEYVNAIEDIGWNEVIHSIENSRKLLISLWNLDASAVARGINKAHEEVSILQYNDENALSYTINLAFYYAKEYYTIVREMPSGKGFADICMIPRKLHLDKPAVVIELKWDKTAQGAIEQIKNKNYTESLCDYRGNLLLAGITYDKKTKTHVCSIEKMQFDERRQN